LLLDPADGSVALSGGLSLTVRTHRQGTVRLSVSDRIVSVQFLGRTDLDDRNQLATFYYVGVPLLAGPNRITVNALYADRDGGQQEELTVYGRGVSPLVRIMPSRETLPADGRSFAELTLELVDAWGNPAQDARLRVQTTLGHLEQE